MLGRAMATRQPVQIADIDLEQKLLLLTNHPCV